MMIRKAVMQALLIAALSAAPGGAWAQQAGLPGGANSLQESYQDWRVACRIMAREGGEAKVCGLTQEQTNSQTRQRVLAIEFSAFAGDATQGVLVMPFGLALDSGVTLQIDEQAAMPISRFSTCLPAGCIVHLQFNDGVIAAMKSGAAIAVTGTASDTRQPVAFSISLAGFAPALSRVMELAAQP